MISALDRRNIIELVDEAVAGGARRERACEALGVSIRTVQRWTRAGAPAEDQRPHAERRAPANKLSEAERARVLEVVNEPAHASLAPQQIVARLADQGQYLASASTIYRVLYDDDQQQHRGRMVKARRQAPTTFEADGPNQVWCWDISVPQQAA